jgi:hypothetical protein
MGLSFTFARLGSSEHLAALVRASCLRSMRNRGAFLILLILQCLVKVSPGDISDKQLQGWVDESTLAFTGTIVALGSNVASIDAKDGPIIVRVDRVESGSQEALKKFGLLVGKELTVIVNPSFKLSPLTKQGISAVFFVDPLLYEKHIAVTANAIAEDKTVINLSKRLSAAVQRKNEKPLKDAIVGSKGLVTGVVTEIRPLPEVKLARLRSVANGRDIFSEHSPRWKEAVIRVQSVLKGNRDIKMALVVFPSTDDRMWAESPKFTVGQAGTWLLHGDEVTKAEVNILLEPEMFDGSEIGAYTALHPEDFQPKEPGGKNEARIREILKALKP